MPGTEIQQVLLDFRELSRYCSGPRLYRPSVMRDEEDPGTLELMLPRKRGRPPTFGYAMTDAQRAARYRARRAGQAGHADVRTCSDMVLLDKIRAAITAKDAELTGFLVHVLWQRYPLQLK